MKIYNTLPDGNQSADLVPARYFNLAIELIKKSEKWMQDTDEICQTLLVNIDIFLLLTERYPDSAEDLVDGLDRKQIRETFYIWFERVHKKIPVKFREGIKESAENLLSKLDKIEAF